MEIKEIAEKMQSTWAEMKATNEKVVTEARAATAAAAAATKRTDELELKLGRQSLIGQGNPWENKGGFTDADRAFLNYVKKGKAALDPSERKALVEDTTGQYLISPAVETELQRALADLVVVRQLASKRSIDKDRIRVRDIDEVDAAWGKLELGASITESTPTPSEDTKWVEDIYGLAKIGEDELADSDHDLTAYIADSFARKVAQLENLGFLKGRGHTTYEEPEGITVDATLLAAAKTTAAHSAVVIDDFIQCIYAVPIQYRKGSAWIVNSTVELELRKLRWDGGGGAGTGGYFWQPSIAEGRPNTFLGYPIVNDDNMDDLDDTAGVIAVFGNFNEGYRILDRKGISVQRLDELYAEAGLVGFKLHFRCGGFLRRPSNKALVLLKEHSA